MGGLVRLAFNLYKGNPRGGKRMGLRERWKKELGEEWAGCGVYGES